MSSPPLSPSSGLRSVPTLESPKESVVERLFIAPLTFLSFILSLALIDSHNHALRTHSHSSQSPAPTTFLGGVKSILHSLVFKRVGESPYAYVRSPDSGLKDGKGEGNGEPWHWHTKQRKMMKAEVADAFRIRKSVLVGLAILGVLGVVGVYGAGRWAVWVLTGWGISER